MQYLCSFLFALFIAVPAQAEPPRVVADIAPVHALVARVMAGVGAPDLILRPGSTPHGYALRPSGARALQAADLVVWIGPGLTPWLAGPVTSLAPDAVRLELLEAPGTITRPYRGTGDDGGGQIDPHAWLDPENGRIWLSLIAEQLAVLDPDNAGRYRVNAAAGRAALARLTGEIETLLAPVKDRPYVTYHDAYQYFESRFGLAPVGAVSLGDAGDPSPARLVMLARKMHENNVACAFSEPQFDDGLLRAAAGGAALKIAVLDPMGGALTPGVSLYPDLLRAMARAFADCLAPQG